MNIVKSFLVSTKGKIISCSSGAAVVIAVVVAIILSNKGYRSIVVDALTGSARITNQGNILDAFVGQKLVDGDEVDIPGASDMTLFIDQDKYIYAEENSHFWIEAKGKKGDTRTFIRQDEGANLYRIDNKLTDAECYDVATSNASLSVRGTVFRVTCREDVDGYYYTIVEVFEGEVYVEAVKKDGTSTGKSKILKAGDMTIIRADDTISEFLEDANHDEVREIEYYNIPENTAKHLGDIIDSGRTLCITKELLYDYVGINDHKYEKTGEYVEATCDLDGYEVEICIVCGAEKHTETEPAIPHEYIEEVYEGDCDTPGYIARVCIFCGEEVERTETGVKAHEYGEWKVIKEATTTSTGIRVRVCADCGQEEQDTIKKLKDKKPVSANVIEIVPTPSPAVSNNVAKLVTTVTEALPEPTPTPETKDESSSSSSKSDDTTPTCVHDYSIDLGVEEATCAKAAIQTWECSKCGKKREDTVGPVKPHTASAGAGYQKIDDNTHGRECIYCNQLIVDVGDHYPTQAGYAIAGATHSYQCAGCNQTITEVHNTAGYYSTGPGATDGHYVACSVCDTHSEATPATTHSFVLKSEASGHWHECICGQFEDGTSGAHIDRSDASGATGHDCQCDVCGYEHHESTYVDPTDGKTYCNNCHREVDPS